MKKIVILASGSGTNAENIIKYFKHSPVAKVALVLSNKKNAKVLERAKLLDIKTLTFNKKDFYESDLILKLLKKEADYIILAGFLWKVPEKIVKTFPNKIINIHPALLPKYGGKGMYGNNVHKAVIAHKEKETGITIHYVNENYDEGAIIFQDVIAISPEDTPDTVAEKVHQMEYKHFPKIIKKVILGDLKKSLKGF